MGSFIRLLVLAIGIILIIFACNRPVPPPLVLEIRLTKQAVNATEVFNRVGQVITYNYVVTNAGTSSLAGPVTITDDKVTSIPCQNLNTVGNLDNNLDPSESVTCTGTYAITQADLTACLVTNTATATVGGQTSVPASTTVPMCENKVLTLAVSASPTTYSAAGQQITYNYTINNTGATTLGPTQFVVQDSRFGAAFNCGAGNTTLPTNQTVSCPSPTPYTISANDMNQVELTSTVTASGGGAVGQPVTITIKNAIPPGTGGDPNLTRGSTIRHKVVEGEWMLQIARCYAADFNAVVAANRNVTDADLIFPFPKTPELIIPNIGSVGTIWGPKDCVVIYPYQSGDSWESIALKFNADIEVLRAANVGKTLTNGTKLKIPRNSAKGSSVPVPTTPVPIPTTPVPTTPVPTTGVERVADIKGGNSDPAFLAVFNGTLYFAAVGSNDTGNEFWKYDGTLKAASLVKDINPGQGSSDPAYLTVFNGALYFKANGNDGAGAELWRYNGSDAGRLGDINAGSGDSNPAYLAVFNNALYFSANGNDGTGVELWKTDGTTTGRVADIHSGSGDSNPAYLTVFNNALYFSATSNDGAGTELWKYDGTNAPTRVADINAGVGNSNPAYLAVFNNILYFSANANDGTGLELWKYDGTNAPTRAADINAGAGDSAPTFMTVFNSALYFGAIGNDGAGYELWKFDGTNAARVTDINKAGNTNPAYLAVYNNELYFRADGGDGAGTELWKFR